MPTSRLNISLIDDDLTRIEELRIALEKRLSLRLSWAQVVRIAIAEQSKAEANRAA